jgi:hypothetical protein
MQESEFTGCVNKVQGRHPPARRRRKTWKSWAFQDFSKKFPAGYVDALHCFLYDELGKGA